MPLTIKIHSDNEKDIYQVFGHEKYISDEYIKYKNMLFKSVDLIKKEGVFYISITKK